MTVLRCCSCAGSSFAAVFGAGQSQLEALLLKRKVMGPSWLLLKHPVRVEAQAQVSTAPCACIGASRSPLTRCMLAVWSLTLLLVFCLPHMLCMIPCGNDMLKLKGYWTARLAAVLVQAGGIVGVAQERVCLAGH